MTDIIIKRTCGHCCGPMLGYASWNNTWLCHPDEGMDCYRLVTLYGHGMACTSCSALRVTSDTTSTAPAKGEFCHEHFSWLCQAGQGKCQRGGERP